MDAPTGAFNSGVVDEEEAVIVERKGEAQSLKKSGELKNKGPNTPGLLKRHFTKKQWFKSF